MKTLSVLALIFLLGCASRPTMEQLEAEASVSGDWTAVEKREQMIERMRANVDGQCPDGQVYYCKSRGKTEICECASSRNMDFYD